jgi:hypothetical protein
MTQSWNSQVRKLERDMTKAMNKTVNNVNRKLARNPIRLPVSSGLSKDGITVQNIDNSVKIQGDVHNSQIGGSGHIQINVSEANVKGILDDIKEFSKTLNDEDREQLAFALSELQNGGKIESDSSKSFLEKHKLISMGIDGVVSWVATAGLDGLRGIIQHVFSN